MWWNVIFSTCVILPLFFFFFYHYVHWATTGENEHFVVDKIIVVECTTCLGNSFMKLF